MLPNRSTRNYRAWTVIWRLRLILGIFGCKLWLSSVHDSRPKEAHRRQKRAACYRKLSMWKYDRWPLSFVSKQWTRKAWKHRNRSVSDIFLLRRSCAFFSFPSFSSSRRNVMLTACTAKSEIHRTFTVHKLRISNHKLTLRRSPRTFCLQIHSVFAWHAFTRFRNVICYAKTPKRKFGALKKTLFRVGFLNWDGMSRFPPLFHRIFLWSIILVSPLVN